MWDLAFGGIAPPTIVRAGDVDDPFAGDRSYGDSDDDGGDAVVREEFVTDYETEVNVRGAAGGTFKEQSKMTPEERAEVALSGVLADYDFADTKSVARAIIKWFDTHRRVDLSRVHIPTFVAAWLWYQRHSSNLKGLPTECKKHNINPLCAAIYVKTISSAPLT